MISFRMNGERQTYQVWWDENCESISLEMERIGTKRKHVKRKWRCESSRNRNWRRIPVDLDNGVYCLQIWGDAGNLLYQDEFWIGRRKPLQFWIEPWLERDYYKVTIDSPLYLTSEDFFISTSRRSHIRAAQLQEGDTAGYSWTFLVKTENPNQLEIHLSDRMESRLGEPLRQFKGKGRVEI